MKQKNQILFLVGLVVVAVAIWYWQWHTPSVGGSGAGGSFAQNYQTLNFPNPEIQWWKVDRRHKAEYKGEGINPFSTVVPPSPVEVQKAADDAKKIAEQQKNLPPPPPPPPELPANLKFFGYGNIPNNTARRAFLSDGDEVYIVNEGDTLLGRFRILKINNSNLEFEEVGSGRRGQKLLEDQGPAA